MGTAGWAANSTNQQPLFSTRSNAIPGSAGPLVQREGMFNPELAEKLETLIYSDGDTRELVEDFLGREVDPGALARRMGAVEKVAAPRT